MIYLQWLWNGRPGFFFLLPLYYIEWPKNLLWWYFMNFIRDHPCMYYVITKGGGEGQKTPNHDYVIHGWSLIRIRFKKLKLCQIFPNNLFGKINKQNVRFDKKKTSRNIHRNEPIKLMRNWLHAKAFVCCNFGNYSLCKHCQFNNIINKEQRKWGFFFKEIRRNLWIISLNTQLKFGKRI